MGGADAVGRQHAALPERIDRIVDDFPMMTESVMRCLLVVVLLNLVFWTR
jgi:hypothetical protein